MVGSLHDHCSKHRLTISARNLKSRTPFSKSNPICVVSVCTDPSAEQPQFRECGRTEVLFHCVNPEWSKTVVIDDCQQESSKIRFEIYGLTSPSRNLTFHDFLGRYETTVTDLAAESYLTKTFPLCSKKGKSGKCGEITIATEKDDSEEIVEITCRTSKNLKKNCFLYRNPFLQVYRVNDDGKKTLVYRTEPVENVFFPRWKPFELPLTQLCGDDKQRKIVIECKDYDRNGRHGFMGSCETSAQRLIDRVDVELPLTGTRKISKQKEEHHNYGELQFVSVVTRRRLTLMDIVVSGVQLDFSVAVDLTKSNGQPYLPRSLHYIGGRDANEYQLALQSVAKACEPYNKNGVFRAMGFGAELLRASVENIFPLNQNTKSFNVYGVSGLMEAYERCVLKCRLEGPTKFSPIIYNVAQEASICKRERLNRYQVLFIVTDGYICDPEHTKSAIICASRLPISIIIIGVGLANFVNVKRLDTNDGLLTNKERSAVRNIVKFVALRDFLSKNAKTGSFEASVQRFSKEIFDALPAHISSYRKIVGLKYNEEENVPMSAASERTTPDRGHEALGAFSAAVTL